MTAPFAYVTKRVMLTASVNATPARAAISSGDHRSLPLRIARSCLNNCDRACLNCTLSADRARFMLVPSISLTVPQFPRKPAAHQQ